MNDVRPVYLLAGGRGANPRSTGAIFKAVLQDTGKEKPLIAYVGVASGDDRGFYLMMSRMIKQAGECRVERILIAPKKADLNKARESLQSANAIFISGGDVEAGMKVLKEKNMTGFITGLYRQGGLFFGASAGSIMMAKEWVRWRDPDDDSTAELFPCLDIAPVICDTHAEEDNWEELKAALSLKEKSSHGYGIPSGSCLKVYPDGKLEAVGGAVRHFVRQADRVESLADLKPH
jgi:cyanophycinase-like exopeptidase